VAEAGAAAADSAAGDGDRGRRGEQLTFGRATFVACTLCLSASLNAQDSAVVVPGAEYAISGPLGWLDQWLFGKRYRDLWTD
jgi:hypothetical protein